MYRKHIRVGRSLAAIFFYSIFFDADVIGNSYFRGKGLSKNKPACKNAVARIYGSWTLRVTGSWSHLGGLLGTHIPMQQLIAFHVSLRVGWSFLLDSRSTPSLFWCGKEASSLILLRSGLCQLSCIRQDLGFLA